MKQNLLIGVTGSVASILTPKLVEMFQQDYNICLVGTDKSIKFFNPNEIIVSSGNSVSVLLDNDEWSFNGFTKETRVKHIDLRTWADCFLIAPLSANTLAKMANGLCDNLLTSIIRAWDFTKPILVAPSMNTYMLNNPFTKEHLEKIKNVYDVKVIPSVVKTLACGDYGDGAMANLDTIKKAVDDELTWIAPIQNCRGIPIGNHPGAFGYKRSYYYHTGVDLYCNDGDEVRAVEKGMVVNVENFTGKSLGHSWWEDTKSVLILGTSGVICYGEITPNNYCQIGFSVNKGQLIGNVKRVLPFGKERPEFAGHSLSMLHFELYDKKTTESVSWHHEDKRPDNLLDPTEKLLKACNKVLEHKV